MPDENRTTEANTAETCDIVDVVRNRLRTGQEVYRRDVHLLVDEIERLRGNCRLLALRLLGISPDRNTQTDAEADDLEDKMMRVGEEALKYGR